MSIILLVISLVLFIGLIVTHEFGHFIAARRGGVEIEEFGIFFPPRIYKHKTKAGWDFTINLIPLGGFVKMKGEHDTDTEKGSFGVAPLWTKTKIMIAGITMNLITALIMFTILALIGMPSLLPNQYTVKSNTKISRQETLISQVEPGSPAAKAGLKAQDQLTAIGLPGHTLETITTATNLPNITKSFAGKTVLVDYKQSGQSHQATVHLLAKSVVAASLKTNNPKGYLGVSPVAFTLRRSTWSAPIVAVGFSIQATVLTFQGLGHALGGLGSLIAGAFTGNTMARQNGQTSASSQVSGPIGIFEVLKDGSVLGYQFMLFIIAIIALTLAIMNLLPIPALDGGRLWITLVARAFNRPLSAHVEEVVNATGFVILIGLSVVIAFVDIHRFF
jgi:regulator of sigma E protease